MSEANEESPSLFDRQGAPSFFAEGIRVMKTFSYLDIV